MARRATLRSEGNTVFLRLDWRDCEDGSIKSAVVRGGSAPNMQSPLAGVLILVRPHGKGPIGSATAAHSGGDGDDHRPARPRIQPNYSRPVSANVDAGGGPCDHAGARPRRRAAIGLSHSRRTGRSRPPAGAASNRRLPAGACGRVDRHRQQARAARRRPCAGGRPASGSIGGGAPVRNDRQAGPDRCGHQRAGDPSE